MHGVHGALPSRKIITPVNPSSFSPDDSKAIGFQAAEWLIKRDRIFTPEEQDAFFEWLASDPRHGEEFARQQRTWKEFNQLAEWRPEHSAEPNPDLLAKAPIRAGSDSATLAGSEPARRVTRWLAWSLPLAAAACVALVFGWSRRPVTTPPAQPTVVTAQTYERRVLEDGSVVELNAGAKIEVHYRPAERRVKLVQGEASFTVAKNHDRPFIVRAAGVDVRAVGTVFNVRLAESSVEVLVTEGRVRVDDAARGESLLQSAVPGESAVLSAGQRVSVASLPIATVPAVDVSPAQAEQLLGWRPVMLEFNSLPLREVVAQFNGRNRTQLLLGDAALAELPIVATFRSDNVEGFVRLLEATANVHAEHGQGTITLRAAP